MSDFALEVWFGGAMLAMAALGVATLAFHGLLDYLLAKRPVRTGAEALEAGIALAYVPFLALVALYGALLLGGALVGCHSHWSPHAAEAACLIPLA